MTDRRSLASLAMTFGACAFIALLGWYVHGKMMERVTLISANENERILNALVGGLREHEGFGAVVEADSYLQDRVRGIGLYARDNSLLYTWGDPSFLTTFQVTGEAGDRFSEPDQKNRSIVFASRAGPLGPPPPDKEHEERDDKGEGHPPPPDRKGFFFDVFLKGEWLYLDIAHTDYWRSRRVLNGVIPALTLLLMGMSFFVRHLSLRNLMYRESLETQRNLVILGTAASTLAHEIKNPLFSIRLQTGLMRKNPAGDHRLEIDTIDAETARLTDLVYRINDFIRESGGKPEVIPLASFVRGIATAQCGPGCILEDESGGVEVMMDPERLRSVLQNLLRNALESANEGSVEPGLPELRMYRRGSYVSLEVLDRGAGLVPGAAENAFEPFFTTKSRGTGLGLAISRRFIQAAGGTIELKNREGGGAMARILLPVKKENIK